MLPMFGKNFFSACSFVSFLPLFEKKETFFSQIFDEQLSTTFCPRYNVKIFFLSVNEDDLK